MDWILDFRKDGILEIRASGMFTNGDLIKMAEQIITHPLYKPGMNAVADFRNVTSNGMKISDLFLSRDIHAQFDNIAGKAKIAVILEEKAGFFLSRAYEAIASMYIKSKIKSFEDYEEGFKWVFSNED